MIFQLAQRWSTREATKGALFHREIYMRGSLHHEPKFWVGTFNVALL